MTCSRLLILAAALAATAACSGTVDPLPLGADVTCSSTADCPTGAVCSTALGRCIPSAIDDRTPPGLVPGTASVSPGVARAGTPITIAFEVDEDLAVAPEVRFSGAPTTLGTPRRDGRRYTVEFPASADDGAGAHQVVARLLDLAGNVAETVPVGTLTLDFTPPGAVLQPVTPGFARRGDLLRAVVAFSEPLGAAPTLTLGAGGPALTAAQAGATDAWAFTRTLDGTEPEGLGDLFLDAEDLAGNRVARRFTDAASLDFTLPAVARATVQTPAVRAGDTFVATATFSEPLGGSPTAALVPVGGGPPVPVLASAIDATTWAISREVPLGQPDGLHDLVLLSASDRAGNALAQVTLGSVTFDSTPPSPTGLAVDHASGLYRAGQPVQVTFTASEPLAAAPAVRLELFPSPLDLTCTPGGNRAWSCASAALDGTERPESVVNVSVTLRDVAGNLGFGSRALVLDFTPPALAAAAVRLIPGPTNLRSAVTAVGGDSTARLTLTAAEPLSAAPQALARDAASGNQKLLTLVNQAGTTYVYDFSTDFAPYPAATWTVVWNPTDEAGNAWPLASLPVVATIPVDGTPPPAPVTGTAASPLLTWERTPWGSDVATATSFLLRGAAGSVSGGDLAIAWAGAGASALEAGRAPIVGGAFTLDLHSDPTDLWVSVLDGAGNEGPRTRVVDVVWTAGLTGKVPGSTFENPHRLDTRAFSTQALTQGDAVEVAGDLLGLAGDGLSVLTSGASVLRPVAGLASPGARRYYGLAQDAGRGVVVLYGGMLTGGAEPGDTWEWDGGAWTQVTPTDPEGDGNPPTTDGASMAFDPVRGGVLLATTNLWLWNGTSWRKLDGGQVAPGYQGNASMAWDAARGVMVYFGGGFGNRVWEWNGSAWRDATPATGPQPEGRSYHKLAWDPVHRRILMFGGLTLTFPNGARNDLWAWSGASWSPIATAGTPPPGRSDFAMAWDAGNGELVVHGGHNGTTTDGAVFVLRDVNGTPTWFDVTPAGSPVLLSHDAVYDQRLGRVVAFGDFTSNALRLWAGSGTPAWLGLAPGDPEGDGNPTYSSFTTDGSMTYLPGRGVTVFQDSTSRNTWEWNRASWARRVTAGGPTARSSPTIGAYGATGSTINTIILFGGSQFGSSIGDTWRWDGATWTQVIASPARAGATHNPALRQDVGMATNPATGRLYRFGGGDQFSGGLACYNDLQYWNGLAWVLQGGYPGAWADPEGDGSPGNFLTGTDGTESCGPQGRLAWHAGRGSLLLIPSSFGNLVWEWRPATNSWLNHTFAGAIPTFAQAFFYDPSLDAAIALEDGTAWAADLATDTWVELPIANPSGLGVPANGIAAYDAGVRRLVGIESSTWTWESGTAGTPAHVFTVDFSRANGPDPGACVDRTACPIQSVEVRWIGGATAPLADGAFLQAWLGDWRALAFTGATPDAPGQLVWTWTPAEAFPASTLFHGQAKELTFALVPDGRTTAAGAARLGTDAVSVTVRYRRP